MGGDHKKLSHYASSTIPMLQLLNIHEERFMDVQLSLAILLWISTSSSHTI
jgi:hypothetical protein